MKVPPSLPRLVFCFLFLSGPWVRAAPIQDGDRIAIVGNTFADQLRNHGYLETLLLHEFADDPIAMRNLGWGGDTLTARDRPTNFPTEESTLNDHETDVIIACFGMGESFAGEAGIENFRKDLRAFIESHQGKQYNGHSDVRLILLSPIAYENLGELTPNWKSRNRDLNTYTQAMREVAGIAKVPFVDLYTPTGNLFEDPGGSQFTTNGIHLNGFGYWAVSNLIFEQLMGRNSKKTHSWQLHIDAKTGAVSSNGVELYGFSIQGQSLSISVEEKSGPSLPPPPQKNIPEALSKFRDRLTIENLPPGEYSLKIDGQPIATATHEEWAQGVPIDASPAHGEVEDYRAGVIEKNTDFTYSWKALNQVHIVGERRSSRSGRALPAEVEQFKQMGEEKEASLGRGIRRKIRQWQLDPDTKLTN